MVTGAVTGGKYLSRLSGKNRPPRHVDDQQVIIDRLRAYGHPTDLAEQLLLVFQGIENRHKAHLDRILRQKRF
jgi:hypothetical protein